jgi:hypothetical protein
MFSKEHDKNKNPESVYFQKRSFNFPILMLHIHVMLSVTIECFLESVPTLT